MKISEYRSMSVGEVAQHLAERQGEFSNLRFQLVTKQLASPISVRRVRREIAQLKTVLREHELGLHSLGAPQAIEGESPEKAQEVKET
ncbi:MAG: 50S ribosomal protein L29 [Candidatus Handelsmanbacteria bacterium RIFCSPLOWO2_12_FULL_64_10]|uniref:Large ribosomal subunit protein uL29 n=1 Tax=Handelsmanbacteria sp. (strain RIFCSPLOWO2_12_FULL_64_10) TaxID=1817868 RepID=A0A1F6C983_HANXR|nr:MAG: 50S ribosomal protein L29 [Candidatus Handelsmanbacteria bacterium RIFCSPLOWO2_12_FULL_64_10]